MKAGDMISIVVTDQYPGSLSDIIIIAEIKQTETINEGFEEAYKRRNKIVFEDLGFKRLDDVADSHDNPHCSRIKVHKLV